MTSFLWIKVLHILAVISWMAGLLYLPRLFVYHVDQTPGSQSSDMLKVMEYRLFRYIMRPAMIVAWLSGAWLAYSSGFWTDKWFWVKVLFVLAMTGFHEAMGGEMAALSRDERKRSSKFFRVANEVPTLFMILIVILVVVKPF